MKIMKALPYMLVGTAGFALGKAMQTTMENMPKPGQVRCMAARKTSELAHDAGSVISELGDDLAAKMR